MRIVLMAVLALGMPGVMIACGGTTEKPEASASKCASCADAKAADGWCADCNVGFVDGAKVKCQGCHTQKTGGAVCEACSMPATCAGCETSGGKCEGCQAKAAVCAGCEKTGKVCAGCTKKK